MGYPSATPADPAALPAAYRATISADVGIPTAGTFVDIATLGTLPAGTYLVGASCVVGVITAANQVTGKVWDGTVVYGSAENTTGISAAGEFSVGPHLMILQSPAAIKFSVTATGSGQTTVRGAALPDNGAGTAGTATGIWALKIG